MSRDQIQQRIDAGDLHGATKLAVKQALQTLPEVSQPQVRKAYDGDPIHAAQEFLRLHPDYEDSQTNYDLMSWALGRQNGDPANIRDLSRAWQMVKTVLGSDTKRAPAQAAAVAPSAPPAPPPEPEVSNPIEREARRMIAVGEISNELVRRLSAKDLEFRCRNLAFVKALEILEAEKPSVTPTWTRGDLNVAYGRAAHSGITLDEELARMASEPASLQPQPQQQPELPRSGVVNIHRGQGFAKPLPSLQKCLANERADHEWIEEQRIKSARAIRVRTNRRGK